MNYFSQFWKKRTQFNQSLAFDQFKIKVIDMYPKGLEIIALKFFLFLADFT